MLPILPPFYILRQMGLEITLLLSHDPLISECNGFCNVRIGKWEFNSIKNLPTLC